MLPFQTEAESGPNPELRFRAFECSELRWMKSEAEGEKGLKRVCVVSQESVGRRAVFGPEGCFLFAVFTC